ncbi:cbb3-type cytochrome c oxidase subunit II [filamentous cyanobacterium LEGE 11480]|uniref:Cbb3-type cytochrome c oxidase subunit II n=1 Tax=Romeriopsis navalis LEGE 11480 TaxID=2777977 RepID=A0A928Z6C9_9CYAN|nr:cbb3-type cytochrome c oxidase subunit II [Romeriopsis navalis]MBE9032897.1 cbb3-type cytochrome c oxidase subunit II [Romeriopsis navalis LEGE 11480]
MKFKFFRTFPIIVGLSILFGLAFSGLVVAPVFTSSIATASPGLVAYTPTEQHGRQIYLREGCVYCHSQQVRSVKADEPLSTSFGAAKAGDYYYDSPNALGTSRQGPDLSNEGRVWSKDYGDSAREYLIGHFKNPRAYNPQSIMPAYDYLSDSELSDLTDYMQALGAWKDHPPEETP